MIPAIASFVLALLLSLALVPIVGRLSLVAGWTVAPRPDRWHRQAMPALGGLAIFAACLLALGGAALLGDGLGQVRWGLLGGSLVVFLLGLYDDLRPLTPPTKLLGQILAAAVAVALGYSTQFFTPRLPGNPLAQIPNLVLTFAWLVGITNAFNLLDNMDGLAGGVALIAAAILSFFFWKLDNQGLLLISLALAGSALGFLVFNFPPARIFMGDSGSLFLGFTLAVLAIARQPQASNVFAVMAVPTMLFLLPILDTALVTFTRLLRGQSPAQGGRDHASHRLVAFGLNERQAVLALYAVALVSGALAALLESLAYWFSLVAVPVLVISLALLSAYLGGLKVVAPPAAPEQRGFFARAVMELTYRRRILEILLDFFVIGIALYLAMLTHFRLAPGLLERYLQLLPLALAGAYLALFLAGVYRGVWRYLEIGDLGRHLLAALAGTGLTGLAARAA